MIGALMILVVISLVSVGMFRSFGLQGKIAGNTMEQQRSMQAAESAVQYGEWWLRQGGGASGGACSGVVDLNNVANMRVCTTPLTPATATALPWPVGGTYTPPRMVVQAGGGVNTSGTGIAGDVLYSNPTSLYIAYLGTGPDGSQMYQVTGAGYGGNGLSASVVQSVYSMSGASGDLSGP